MAEKWSCTACTFLNEATHAACDVCQEPRLKAARPRPPPKRPAPPVLVPAPRTQKRRRRVVESSDESDGDVVAVPPRTAPRAPAPAPRRVSPDTTAGAPVPARPDPAALRSEWRRLCAAPPAEGVFSLSAVADASDDEREAPGGVFSLSAVAASDSDDDEQVPAGRFTAWARRDSADEDAPEDAPGGGDDDARRRQESADAALARRLQDEEARTPAVEPEPRVPRARRRRVVAESSNDDDDVVAGSSDDDDGGAAAASDDDDDEEEFGVFAGAPIVVDSSQDDDRPGSAADEDDEDDDVVDLCSVDAPPPAMDGDSDIEDWSDDGADHAADASGPLAELADTFRSVRWCSKKRRMHLNFDDMLCDGGDIRRGLKRLRAAREKRVKEGPKKKTYARKKGGKGRGRGRGKKK